MARIILQPTGNKDARAHYVNTIKTFVPSSVIKSFMPTLSADIDLNYPDGKVYICGVTPGVGNGNVSKWNKIKKGDVTLFSDGGIFASATTTMKFHCKALATHLWGTNSSGQTWEYIYLVKEIKNTRIPYSILNPTIGYDSRYVIQGFNVLDQDKSNKVFARFDLYGESVYEDVTPTDYSAVIDALEKSNSLDSEVKANTRKEQSFLREQLFGTNTKFKCGICGKELPVEFLITSHIKRRCDCTKTEKLDYANIVMPMCKCGCDDAYEKGYIYVDDTGHIKVNTDKTLTSDLSAILMPLDGKVCSYHNSNTEKYFKAHRERFGK